MPAININLIEHKNLDNTPLGNLLRWSLTYGRYIIVCTEIVVLLAFIWRFSLDRTITDLSEEIDQKIAIIEANAVFENQFRNLQQRIVEIGKLSQNQNLGAIIIRHLEQITPSGIQFASLNYDGKKINIQASAASSVSLKIFLKNLKSSEYLTNINLVGLNKSNTGKGETIFQIEAMIKNPSISEGKTSEEL